MASMTIGFEFRNWLGNDKYLMLPAPSIDPQSIYAPSGPNGEPISLTGVFRLGTPKHGDVFFYEGHFRRHNDANGDWGSEIHPIFEESHNWEQEGSGI